MHNSSGTFVFKKKLPRLSYRRCLKGPSSSYVDVVLTAMSAAIVIKKVSSL